MIDGSQQHSSKRQQQHRAAKLKQTKKINRSRQEHEQD